MTFADLIEKHWHTISGIGAGLAPIVMVLLVLAIMKLIQKL